VSQAEPIPGWNALQGAIATARGELAAAAPDKETAAEADAYVMRVLTANFTDGFLNHLLTADGLMRALPTKGGPNPDYIMTHAAIDPTRRYSIEGHLHDSERVGVGLYSVTANGALSLEGYAAFERSDVNPDGHFNLGISADAQGDGTLRLTPSCRVLLVRILTRNSQGRPARIALTGASQSPTFQPAQDSCERTLMLIAQTTLRAIRQYIRWSQLNAATPNRFTAPPPEMADEVQGDPDTHYCLGRYDLAAGQWLEVQIPQVACRYWSLHAYNHWCEYLPGASAHDLNAIADDDGFIRVHIGPSLAPTLPNRVDTLGRHRGVLIFRTIGASELQPPYAKLKTWR